MLLLCWEFLKTGLLAVGGGLATIPFLTQIAQRYPQWLSLSMLADIIAVSESTPGPIGVNMATFVGYRVAGIPGAFFATFSLVLPSFIILMIISHALRKYRSNDIINAGFMGIRPAVTGLIAAVGYSMLRLAIFVNNKIDLTLLVLFLVLFTCTQIKKLKNLHPITYIAISALVGIIFSL